MYGVANSSFSFPFFFFVFFLQWAIIFGCLWHSHSVKIIRQSFAVCIAISFRSFKLFCLPAPFSWNTFDRVEKMIEVWKWKRGMIWRVSTWRCHNGVMLRYVCPNQMPFINILLRDGTQRVCETYTFPFDAVSFGVLWHLNFRNEFYGNAHAPSPMNVRSSYILMFPETFEMRSPWVYTPWVSSFSLKEWLLAKAVKATFAISWIMSHTEKELKSPSK